MLSIQTLLRLCLRVAGDAFACSYLCVGGAGSAVDLTWAGTVSAAAHGENGPAIHYSQI